MKNIYRKIMRKVRGGKMKIGCFDLVVDRSHNLPYILDAYPDYGMNLVRLARALSTKCKEVRIIDVGANIGDSIAMLLDDDPTYQIIAIEGDDHYFSLLSKNFGDHHNVEIYKTFLGDKNSVLSKKADRKGGTLRLESDDAANATEFATLDAFISKHPNLKDIQLLKIDTDGYDNKIIRGADRFLIETKPAIYFEYDAQYLLENGEKGPDIFDFLKKHGYSTAVFFDNYGRFLLSTANDDARLLDQLDRYIQGRKGAFAYYDIVVFHDSDNAVAESFIASEQKRL